MAGAHTAGLTFTAREYHGRWAAEQIVEVINGQIPPRLIKPDARPCLRELCEKLLGPAAASG